MREATPIFFNEPTNQWMITRFDDVREALRDRRLAACTRIATPTLSSAGPSPIPRWAAFDEHERWSLLQLEPPDHTRIRRLIAKVFTPTAVAAVRADRHRNWPTTCSTDAPTPGRFELLADYAQPYSVAVICSLLGVPRADATLLLDWSHAIVKMYELSTTDDSGPRRTAGQRKSSWITPRR